MIRFKLCWSEKSAFSLQHELWLFHVSLMLLAREEAELGNPALERCVPLGSNFSPKSSLGFGYFCEINLLKSVPNIYIWSGFRMISLQSLFLNGSVLLPSRRWWSQCMTMEKGISSVEVLPSKSSQVTAVKVVVKEPETKQTQRGKRVGFVLVHAGKMWKQNSCNGNNACLDIKLDTNKNFIVPLDY